MRHNLSLNKCFEKVETKSSGSSRKGCLWALNLARIDKMEEEMHKWKRKDLAAIHRSMANPGEPQTTAHAHAHACARTCAPTVSLSSQLWDGTDMGVGNNKRAGGMAKWLEHFLLL